MAENSSIEWCSHTFNPWWGCVEVSEGCLNCYARELSHRYKRASWGKDQPRVLASDKVWRDPIGWNRKAMAKGVQARVFCASMADVFEDQRSVCMVDGAGRTLWHNEPIPYTLDNARARLWGLIWGTPWLNWLLLTKRPENIGRMLPTDRWGPGGGEHPANIWLGTTVETQRRAEERIPVLMKVPANVRFLSCEPLLGPIDLDPYLGRALGNMNDYRIDWVIVGGESGAQARPVELDWIEEIVACCRRHKVPVFVKQLGARPQASSDGLHQLKLKDRKGGDMEEFPVNLRIREFP